MVLQRASLVVGLFLLGSIGGCVADTSEADQEEEVSEEAITGAPSNDGYFIVSRRDLRKCASPMCGGLYVKRVNADTTRCADGTRQAECYVSSIQLGGAGLSAREEADVRGPLEDGKALVKARMYKTRWKTLTLGTLKANEAWLGATGSTPDGTFYRAADNGIRCVTAPCPTTSLYALNGGDQHHASELRLDATATPADQASLDRAARAVGTKEGILLAGGILIPRCIAGSRCGTVAVASEFYLRVARREGKSCGSRGMLACNADQYCSYQPAAVCGAADGAGACAYRPFACPQIYAPVCACDGKTYSNACGAAAAGTSVSTQGACAH